MAESGKLTVEVEVLTITREELDRIIDKAVKPLEDDIDQLRRELSARPYTLPNTPYQPPYQPWWQRPVTCKSWTDTQTNMRENPDDQVEPVVNHGFISNDLAKKIIDPDGIEFDDTLLASGK